MQRNRRDISPEETFKWPRAMCEGHGSSGRCHPLLSGQPSSQNRASAGEDAQVRELSYAVDGNLNLGHNYKKKYEGASRIKNRATVGSSNLTPGYISKGTEIRILKKYLKSHVNFSITQIGKHRSNLNTLD